MKHTDQECDDNPMNYPAEQPTGVDGDFQFGRLFAVLMSAVSFIGLLAVTMEAVYT